MTPLPIAPPSPPTTIAALLRAARDRFHALERWLFSQPVLALALHQIEQPQEIQGRNVQQALLQAHIQQRGTGDVGPALHVFQACAVFTHRRLQRRTLKTIFGPIDIDRMGYCHPHHASIHPLDEALQLPKRSFSYELQKRLVIASVQGPLRESIQRLLDSCGLTVPMRSIEHILQDAAQDFDAFYDQRPVAASSPTASILVVAVDCKGIPMVKPAPSHRRARRTKGQKANKKKMATVATVFTRPPWVRTPQQVVESLFRVSAHTSKDQLPPPKPENKRVWASLIKGKATVIDEVAAEVRRRDPDARLTLVALTDGERALQILVSKKLAVILILDLLHVLEKVWKAAHVFHQEGTPEAEVYARRMTHRILEGDVDQVVKGLRQTVTKRKLSGPKAKILLAVAGYFHRNRDRMRYHDYLARGLPIASGPVEGACKNLIKDRMERSGMRWTPSMAEALLKLRALYLSADFDAYWDFHISEDPKRLYPPGRWAVVAK